MGNSPSFRPSFCLPTGPQAYRGSRGMHRETVRKGTKKMISVLDGFLLIHLLTLVCERDRVLLERLHGTMILGPNSWTGR